MTPIPLGLEQAIVFLHQRAVFFSGREKLSSSMSELVIRRLGHPHIGLKLVLSF